ncbi:MAG TPA: hypothetical protein PKH79_04330 [Prolixibacteraceae bacterium]|nr:hypothetical protein [Prolixibacteraceae bacterium]HPS12107.1 hypothetical protein [Prolixibacteraceae bacterium]
MMQKLLPPIVLECPECGEKYLVSPESNRLSENATIYTDGYFDDDQIWRTPGIIGCVTCELGFTPQTGKVIATPDWDDFYQNWSEIKKAAPPTAGSLALELRARRNMNPETEKSIRKEFWYAVNHTEKGMSLFSKNEKFRNFWFESLNRYEELLGTENPDEKLIKAEISRHLGRFEACFSLLDGFSGSLAETIRQEAIKRNTFIIPVTGLKISAA